MTKTVSMLESIEIKASAEKIFDYVSNLNNDPLWRPEVEKMDMQGGTQLGTVTIEYITIYKFFHFITPTVIKVLDKPTCFMVETPDNHPTWVQAKRTIEKLDEERAVITAHLSFSLNNMKQILPISPPGIFVIMWYQPRIRRYLKRLKKILESN